MKQFVGVDMNTWNKETHSINSVCNSLILTEDEKNPKAMINVNIYSNNIDKAVVENEIIPMTPQGMFQGYFLLCSNVIEYLKTYLVEGVNPVFLQQNSGMKPMKVEYKDGQVIIHVLVVIKDDYCNSNYFIRPFYGVEKSKANHITQE